MLSAEDFEVVESVCFLFQVVVFDSHHIVLQGDAEEGCFFTEGDGL